MDGAEIGSIGDETHEGALVWRLLRSPSPMVGDTRLLVVVALKYWVQCMHSARDLIKYTPEIPLVGMPRATPGRALLYFSTMEIATWTEADVTKVGDCLEAGSIMPFEVLCNTHNLISRTVPQI